MRALRVLALLSWRFEVSAAPMMAQAWTPPRWTDVSGCWASCPTSAAAAGRSAAACATAGSPSTHRAQDPTTRPAAELLEWDGDVVFRTLRCTLSRNDQTEPRRPGWPTQARSWRSGAARAARIKSAQSQGHRWGQDSQHEPLRFGRCLLNRHDRGRKKRPAARSRPNVSGYAETPDAESVET